MPTWALIYCSCIVLGTINGLFSKGRIRASYQTFGDVMCGLCGLYTFFFTFGVYEVTASLLPSIVTFVFVNFWLFHAHRHNFRYENARDYINKQSLKMDEKRKLHLGGDFVPEYSYDKSEKEARFYFGFLVVGSVLFYLPFVYAFWLSLTVSN